MTASKDIITTCTRDCPNSCGLLATLMNGEIVKISGSPYHPLTKGTACHKTTKNYLDRLYHKDRIVQPMIKKGSRWQQADWEEALDLIAHRMKSIKRESGPEAILYYQGYGERTGLKLLNSYFFNLFGGVTTLSGSLCGGTGQASQELDFGKRISHDPLDHYNSKSIILWGRNPATTNLNLVPVIQAVKKRGGRIIVIDPITTRSSRLADHHISPAPGRDAFIAMAAAKIVIGMGKEDTDFLKNHSSGAALYGSLLKQYSLDELANLAGVSTRDIQLLADTLIHHKPTSILLGWGLHRHKDSHISIRNIDALSAVSGNIGVPGGGVSQGFEEYGPYDQQYWGFDLNPPRRKLSMPTIGEQILSAANPDIRMIMTSGSNPVCMAPNSNRVAQAFKQTEFKVYSGHFMDDTADLADVFLPATMFLEEDDVMASYGHNYIGPVNKVIEPRGEALSDFHMFSRLAERFSFRKTFCRPQSEWLSKICSGLIESGCSMEELKKGPFRLNQPMVPYQDKIFYTPSKKFTFITSIGQAAEDMEQNHYPYHLLTIASHDYLCSERTLAEHSPIPEIRIHPEEAEENGWVDGIRVKLTSKTGQLLCKLRISEDVRKGCVAAERGGWIKAGHGFNLLTEDMASSVGEGTPYYETRVKISAAI